MTRVATKINRVSNDIWGVKRQCRYQFYSVGNDIPCFFPLPSYYKKIFCREAKYKKSRYVVIYNHLYGEKVGNDFFCQNIDMSLLTDMQQKRFLIFTGVN